MQNICVSSYYADDFKILIFDGKLKFFYINGFSYENYISTKQKVEERFLNPQYEITLLRSHLTS